MEKALLHTPEGVRDIYGEECEKKLYIEAVLMKLLRSFGYQPVETPTFEFFETFSKEVGTTLPRDMFKFFDHDGNTMVLRPDMTPPIVRIVGKYFADSVLPKRFCYVGNTFVSHKSFRGKRFEFTQLGAEYLGAGSADSDAEIVSMMIGSMKTVGLKDYKVIAGHALLDEEVLREAGIEHEFVDSKEALSLIRERVDHETAAKALDELIALEDALCDYGLGNNVVYELGMESNYKYYTGVIFSVYAYGSGQPVAVGGRYDKLAEYFGTKDAAIGFAITIDGLTEALKNSGTDVGTDDKKLLIVYDDGHRTQAVREAMSLREKGIIAELLSAKTGSAEEYKKYAGDKGIEEIRYLVG